MVFNFFPKNSMVFVILQQICQKPAGMLETLYFMGDLNIAVLTL